MIISDILTKNICYLNCKYIILIYQLSTIVIRNQPLSIMFSACQVCRPQLNGAGAPCIRRVNPMKSMLLSATILGLAASSSFAAEAVKGPDSGPLVLTDAQLDKVTGGALANVNALRARPRMK
jgi:hypothetical protein